MSCSTFATSTVTSSGRKSRANTFWRHSLDWQKIARERWPGWSIEGSGRFALVLSDFHAVRLSEFAYLLEVRPGYEPYRKIVELKPVRKMNQLPRQSKSDPARQESD